MEKNNSSNNIFDFNFFTEITKDAAIATMRANLQFQQAANSAAYGFFDAGLSAHNAATSLTKVYLANLDQIQQEYLKKSQELGEKVVQSEYPLQHEISEFNARMIEQTRRVFEFFNINAR